MRQHRAEPGPIYPLARWVPALATLGRDDKGVFALRAIEVRTLDRPRRPVGRAHFFFAAGLAGFSSMLDGVTPSTVASFSTMVIVAL